MIPGRRRTALAALAFFALLAPFAPSPASAQSSAPGFSVLDSASVGEPAPASGGAAGGLSAIVRVSAAIVSRRDLVRSIAEQASFSIVFDPMLPGLDERIAPHAESAPAALVLLRALEGSGARAMVSSSRLQVVLVPRAPAARTPRRVVGIVRDAEGPVAGARVELAGTSHRALTRTDGSFLLAAVPQGSYVVRASRLGYRPVLRQPFVVAGDGDASITVAMTREATALDAVVVTPGYVGLLDGAATSPQSLTREQLETVPQIGEDIYRAINRVPGVAASDFSARFSVRGATADQLYVTLDGLRLIEPFHLKDIGSALSIIDIQTLGSASLVSGGAGAEFGDEIGGVFTMRSLDPRSTDPASAVGASITNLRASSRGTFAGDRGGWLVSGRRGFMDIAFQLASLGDSLRPTYDDAFAKVQYTLPGGGELALHALHSGDALAYLDVGDERLTTHYGADYLWATLRQSVGSRLRGETVVSMGALDWRREGQSSRFVNPEASVHDSRALHSYELRQDWTLRASDWSQLAFGLDARLERASYDYSRIGIRRTVVDGALMSQPEQYAAQLQPRGSATGLYLSHRLRALSTLTLETGARLDAWTARDERVVSPRAALAWSPTDRSTVRSSWGRYVQSEPLFALAVGDAERELSPADRSEQAELSLEQRIGRGLTARVNVYERRLLAQRARFVNATSAIASFPEVAYDRVELPADSGWSRGMELVLARENGAVAWSASYALASVTDRYAGRDVPRATDQRHTLHADWSYHPSDERWRLAVAGTWHSGTPDTPDVVRVDTLVNTPTQFSYFLTWKSGPLYAERVPAYHRIDVRWTRYFATRHGRIGTFAELFNALDHENVRGFVTNVNQKGRTISLVRDVRRQLPRLPSAGVSWEF